ncbi:glutathione S-transferase [Terrihabitans sp. B22-R8]|uniref:glutathione S-transferase n=1 Tax=Terrihabitans sp. B22-R8 TaxID=3425128 RepID=UPI00403C6E27
MKLFYAPTSAYTRKVMVCAHELGLIDLIECLDSAAHPVKRDERIAAFNPLAKIPAAMTEEGELLFDSRVICEYLDVRAGGTLFPTGAARWAALTLQALGDGIVDAAVLTRYETVARPAERQWSEWSDAQLRKVQAALDHLEKTSGTLGTEADIGTIAIGCALGYLDFRFPDLDWRNGHPDLAAWYAAFSSRPSMQATVPVDKPA